MFGRSVVNSEKKRKKRISNILTFCFKLFSECQRFEKDFILHTKNPDFIKPNIFAIACRRHLIFQTINSVLSNNLSLNYQRFILSASGLQRHINYKYIFIRKFEFLARQGLNSQYFREIPHKILFTIANQIST